MAAAADRIHATAVALSGKAALIRGGSGAGKSDLALRCITLAPSALLPGAAELVADDQVELRVREGTLFARAPAALRGLLEVRGLGIIAVPACGEAAVALVVDLVPRGEIPRLPDPPARISLCGMTLPLAMIDPFEPAAAQKLLLALRLASLAPARAAAPDAGA